MNVIEWLKFYKIPFMRINGSTRILDVNIFVDNENSNFELNIQNFNEYQILKSDQISGYWYRRGDFIINREKCKNLISLPFKEFIKLEEYTAVEFIHSLLNDIPSIGNFKFNSTNKLINLKIASSCGLNIPDTCISNVRDSIIRFIEFEKAIIQKAIGPAGYIPLSKPYGVSIYTKEVSKMEIEQKTKSFSLSLFQNKIDKKYELRIFYFFEQMYCTAIFSQNDDKTKIDFRQYNYEKPNRTPKYNLPFEIKERIICFMKKIDLNCGSIDMVVDKLNNYVFLEVNPVGQFSQVSIPSNYNLENKIALKLKDFYEKKQN